MYCLDNVIIFTSIEQILFLLIDLQQKEEESLWQINE